MDGVYETSINTPIGNIGIKIALKQQANMINGMIEIMGNKNPLTNGKVSGNRCNFVGEIKNNTMVIRYNLVGELADDILNIYAKTNMGEFKLKANKIA